MIMEGKIRMAVLVGAMILLGAACEEETSSDDDDDGGGTNFTTGSETSSGETSGGAGETTGSGIGGAGPTSTGSSGASDPGACTEGCTFVYNCSMGELCSGFGSGPGQLSLAEFLNGQMNDGCVASCQEQPIILNLIDPNDCAGTIANLKAANSEFAAVCDGGAG